MSGAEAPAGPRRPLDDEAARELIKSALDRTLVVEAAAGTGKTTALVGRITAVLAEGAARVDEIVAVTFTEKAAGELKLRLRSGLEDARRKETRPAAKGNLEEALSHLEEARVGTIHAFCAELLRERPVEASLDPAFGTLTESESRRLYEQAFDRWFEEQLDAPPEGVRRSLRRKGSRDETPTARLRRAGWELCEWRDFPTPWRRRPFDRVAAIDAVLARLHRFADRSAHPKKPNDTLFLDTAAPRDLSRRIRGAGGRGRDDDEIEAELCALARDRDLARHRKGAGEMYGEGVVRAELQGELGELLEALAAFAVAADADLAALLQGELAGAARRYELLKERTGRLDFVDLLVKARDMIRGVASVRAAFQERFKRVFVDEFQDTDPLQAELLLLLAADDAAVTDHRAITPVPGKLFIVGDPKQAIYRFRRADLAIYQEVKELLVARGATAVELRTSFRSVPAIQRLVNAAFAPRMQGRAEAERAPGGARHAAVQADYVPLAPARADVAEQPAIVALPVPAPFGQRGPTKTAVDRSLPDAVGAFVDWLVHKSGWTVTERGGASERRVPIAARHVCLLFRKLASSFAGDITRPYVQALEARGVAHVLVGGKSFHAREEVGTMVAALSAIEWPDDELSVFATLRGSLFAIGDEALLEYRHRHKRFSPYKIPEGLLGDLADIGAALALLRELHRGRNYRPVADTVSRLLEETRAHAAFALRPSGEQALANVLHLADLGRSFDASGGVSFRGFVERLRDDAEIGAAPEAAILEEASDGVRLMSVHKAKGLEFPVVVLADLTTNMVLGEASRHVDGATRLCATRIGGWSPWELLEHAEAELERDAAEGVRLAYVAATRARDLLVVPAVGDAPAFPEQSWLAPLHAAVYPPPARRRLAAAAPGCPAFGSDSVRERAPGDYESAATVCPGLHALGEGEGTYGVVWWDPHKLELSKPPLFGVANIELLAKEAPPAVVAADLAIHHAWRDRRDGVLGTAKRPSLAVKTATEWSMLGEGATAEVPVFDVPRAPNRPAGKRFGSLVHAVLAAVTLGAEGEDVEAITGLEGKILGATPEEIAAAAGATRAALEHPLLVRARAAAARGECRRETPITLSREGGELIEGVIDLAFREDGAWTLVDFKTDREIEKELGPYQRQLGVYAEAIALTTGDPVTACLLRV